MAQQGRVAKSQIKKGLTPKQTKYVEAIAKGEPGYKAAMIAYDVKSLSVANAISVENQQKPSVKQAVEKALGNHNLTADDAVKPVKEALKFIGETQRESLEMNLKGVDRLVRLLQMTEEKDAKNSGNTFIFNNGQSSQNFLKK